MELVLPETGVCSTDQDGDAASRCCGTASTEPVAVALVGLSGARTATLVDEPAASRSECC